MRQILLVVVFLLVQAAAFSQDIVVTNYTGPTTFSRYEEFSAPITVKNTGIVGTSSSFAVTPYFSIDNQWDASDVEMLFMSASQLGAGQSYSGTTYNRRVDVAPGTYYLIIKGDAWNGITETDETNNILVIPNIIVNAPDVDFTLSSFSLDKTTYTQNDLVTPSYLLQNLGSINVGDYIDLNFVLSTDAVYSTNDTELNDERRNIWGPDNIASNQASAFALPNVATGNYYVIVWVDHDRPDNQSFEETNESNNVFSVPITIQASNVDLSVDGYYINNDNPASLPVSVSVRNLGTTGASGYSIKARFVPTGGGVPYFCTGGDLDATESFIGSGQQKTFNLVFSYPGLPAGTYYLQVLVNQGDIPEANKANNAYIDYSRTIYVAPPPILGVTFNSLSTTGSVDDTDLQINLNLNLTNTGNTSGYYQYYSFVVKNSANATVHSEPQYVYINMGVGQAANKSVALDLASPLPMGSYQVSVSCSGSCNTTPWTRSTTLTVVPTEYTLTGIVKGEDGQEITNGKLFLYKDTGSGNVQFIQKVVPYVGPGFSFPIDTQPYTLYFVPDPIAYPDFVPTIYGKTIALQPSNFFTASSNMNVTFEILKVNPLGGGGGGIITGFVTSGSSSGRSAEPQSTPLSVSSLPVILLSSGQVVGITYTDASGLYEFKNLPRGAYQVLLSVELDSPLLMAPYNVDITEKNMQVNFELGADGNHPVASQYFLPQQITFGDFQPYHYGDPSILLDAQSDAGLPIEYSSSDVSIAEVVNGEVVIRGVGTVLITAKQAGNTFYLPASVGKSLTINKANQTLTLSALLGKTFGDEPFTVESVSSAGLQVMISSSDPAIASVDGNTVHIHGAGVVEIIADQPGNNLYTAAVQVRSQLIIEKASQTISFDPLAEQTSDAGSFELSASSSSGLDITFESGDDEIVSIAGNIATIHKHGVVDITARQPGNENYKAGEDVVRTLVINVVLAVEELDFGKHVYPNPTTDFVSLDIKEPIRVVVLDHLGRIRGDVTLEDKKLNFSSAEAGVYVVKIIFGDSSVAYTRIVKR